MWLAALAGLFLTAATLTSQVVDGNRDEFLRWLRERSPSSGYYELLVEGAEPGDLSLSLYVLDIESGTQAVLNTSREPFVLISTREALRRGQVTPEGVVWQPTVPPNPYNIGPIRSDWFLPPALVAWLLDHPALVDSAARAEDGGWQVRCVVPRSRPRPGGVPPNDVEYFSPSILVFDFDSDAVLLSADAAPRVSSAPMPFVYSDKHPRRRMVLDENYLKWRWIVKRCVVLDHPPPDLLTDEWIIRRFEEDNLNSKRWSSEEVAARLAEDGLEPRGLDPESRRVIDAAKGRRSPASRAFVISGILLIVATTAGWWWARRGKSA